MLSNGREREVRERAIGYEGHLWRCLSDEGMRTWTRMGGSVAVRWALKFAATEQAIRQNMAYREIVGNASKRYDGQCLVLQEVPDLDPFFQKIGT